MATEQLRNLSSIQCHRVMDNKELTMSGEDFWIQLNYHLIHLLDFLPAASWSLHAGDNFMDSFTALHALLTRVGKLYARVDFDASEASSLTEGQPNTLASMIRNWIPPSVQLGLARRQVGGFSDAIGHSLAYQLEFEGEGNKRGKHNISML